MPNLNGTGPMGKGAMTGRGLGQCKQAFASKLNQIQHETGEPHPPHKIPQQQKGDVFVKRSQNIEG